MGELDKRERESRRQRDRVREGRVGVGVGERVSFYIEMMCGDESKTIAMSSIHHSPQAV